MSFEPIMPNPGRLHRWLLCLLLIGPAASRANDSQPEYDAALARIHGFIASSEATTDACAHRLPDDASHLRSMQAQWKAANASVIAEVEVHVGAMLPRVARENGTSEAAEREAMDRFLRRMLGPALSMIAAADDHEAQRICTLLSANLRVPQANLESKYVSQLQTLRRCEEQGTCPLLHAKD